jgi:coenzyme F420-reducing hydrogenase delta subunit
MAEGLPMTETQNSELKTQNSLDWQPRILAFLCNWCSYAGADLAGVSRLQYPPNVRVIRVPCSARVDPLFVLAALQRGADGVLVSGCHPGDCHYLSGNLVARRRFVLLKALLDEAGFETDRVHFSWVSAAEGARFAELIREVTDKVRALGPARQFVRKWTIDNGH